MIPCPREYTSVFAVPRSIARSLARGCPPVLTPAVLPRGRRSERVEALLKLVDAGTHAERTLVAQQDDRRAQRDTNPREYQKLH